jgi:hypothetical protein
LNTRLGGTQSWSGLSGGEKNLLPLTWFKPQIIHPVAWSLHQLCYPSISPNNCNELDVRE